ncbi:hypothetical protein GCM10023231_35900 [Olivibacter ginsenosidimutans]|uniref:DUF4292 domain-containing protein n=1 Tax=Olivibacter ginsenosidimutans TaxID=1176537 RepID=A0ABP9C201_9SPHI
MYLPKIKTFFNALVITLLLLTAFSCKSKKAILNKKTETISAINDKVLLSGILDHELTFKTFSAKAKSAVAINKDVYDATLNIKIKDKEAIWISITTLFGIEAARVLITPSRFKLMNRLNGTYIDQPFHFLHQFASSEISYDNLQAMMVGNMVQQALAYAQTAEKNTQGYRLNGAHEDLNFAVQTNEQFKITNCELRSLSRQQEVNTVYTNFEKVNEHPIARDIRLMAKATSLTLDLQLTYNRIALNEGLEMPFTIPTKYKELVSNTSSASGRTSLR